MPDQPLTDVERARLDARCQAIQEIIRALDAKAGNLIVAVTFLLGAVMNVMAVLDGALGEGLTARAIAVHLSASALVAALFQVLAVVVPRGSRAAARLVAVLGRAFRLPDREVLDAGDLSPYAPAQQTVEEILAWVRQPQDVHDRAAAQHLKVLSTILVRKTRHAQGTYWTLSVALAAGLLALFL